MSHPLVRELADSRCHSRQITELSLTANGMTLLTQLNIRGVSQ